MARIRSAAAAAVSLLVLSAVLPAAGFAQDPAVPNPASAAGQATPGLPAAEPIPSATPVPGALPNQAEPNAPAAAVYTAAQLDQILAPVALYPDTLLTNILMASTYPLQIVEAERWLQDPHNAALKGDAIVAALDPMPWDPSVKSLVPFPQIVKQMNDQLDWTQSLGTAVANQQADVMEQVQFLRHQSESCGKLVSTPQQHVRHEGAAVVIEPANPAVVYVPVYNPAVVYGVWAYPAYPPLYFAPAPGFFIGPVGVDIGFSIGFGIVGPLWGWGVPVWGTHSFFINNVAFSRISFNHTTFVGSSWHHVGPIGRVGAAPFHAPGAGRSFAGAAHAGAGRGFAHAGAGRGSAHGSSRSGGTHGSASGHGFSRANAGSHGFAGRSAGAAHSAGSSHFSGRGAGGGHSSAHAAASHFGGHAAGGHVGGGHAASGRGGTHRH